PMDTAPLAIDGRAGPAQPAAFPRPVPFPRAVDPSRWVLAGVLVLAVVLRLRGLSTFPLEQDEIYTVMEGRDLFDVPLAPGIHARPLYFLLQHVLLGILPETEAGLRIVPFLLGVAGVWAVWHVGRRVFGTAAGGVGALLVALSPWHLHASGMARYWTLLFLLSTLYVGFLWEAYGTDRPGHYRAALVALVLGSATHPSFFFPAAGAALGVTLLRADGRWGWRWPSRTAWWNLWGPYALFLAVAALALRMTGNAGAVQNWSGRGWAATLRLLPAIVEWATPTLVAAGVLGALLAVSGRSAGVRRWGAMALAGGVVTVAGLLWAAGRTDVYADYAFAMLPLLFVSAGGLVQLGIDRMRGGRAVAAAAAASVLVAGLAPGTASHLSDGTRFDYRPALRQVQRTAPDVTVAAWPVVVAERYAPTLRYRGLPSTGGGLERLLAEEGELWAVVSARRYGLNGDDDGSLEATLARRCILRSAHERPRWDYRVYRVLLYRCGADGGSSGGSDRGTARNPSPAPGSIAGG
ncbi:MAG TPA: glycosyltransferase family 39 protein, partial [Longimicrobium sp.]|nr:glycosyltransferase family 39 protein [Longimicrobium sp.]